MPENVSPTSAELLDRVANGNRAACIEAARALALRRDRDVLPAVAHVLRHGPSTHSRELAAWLLGELAPGTEETLAALHEVIANAGATDFLRGQAMESLGNQVCAGHGSPAREHAADVLMGYVQHPSVELAYNAVFALGTMRCERARATLERIAREDVRRYNRLDTMADRARFALDCLDGAPRRS